ncbi:MAG: phosphate regulon transcriptional regulator PhoB [Deltaproteobacteria bacterium]|jgi:phosphate regulon transcriptional regulator PhoB|nr:phosphate regulon transcriptional regulator PhoB [Deltaproteobacteria bacterium]MBN2846328.1 phosphate regulon transcriptional regulator PhoB [Deltaproteobacteria bacterium]
MTRKILIVDDEKDIVDLISYNLEKEGFSTIKAYDGEWALTLVKEKKPDLMILDLMLPGIQGIDVCKLIRGSQEMSDLPIIMLTAKGDESDRILGLELGADDYITKPFSVRELIARVRTILRRTEERKERETKEPFSYKGLTIDHTFHSVTARGEKIDLSPTEFKLLTFLATHPGRVYTRDQLLDYVWGDEAFVEPRTVDVHIRRLRSQIEEDSANPQYIFTVRGFGYKFADI